MGKRCGNCANSTWLKGNDDVPEVCLECKYVHAEPSNWKEKTMTNADRIRAMSDEELAHWICKKMMSCSSNVCPGADLCQSGDGLANGLVKWLKQPVED